MKTTPLLLTLGLVLSHSTIASESCFLITERNRVIKQEGDCQTRYAPCSTFKIAISLMGYDDNLLKNETKPEYPFKKGYADYLAVWKEPHNPTLWMKNSCIWYSQVLTEQLGMKKFKDYVELFNYGNKDVSGDKGKNNGLTHAWLSSSLEISPIEQTQFLQKMLDHNLPVSVKAQEMTNNILFLEELPNGWKLYGKTGSGSLLNADKTQKLELQHGWFVGYLKKDQRTITFAYHIVDDEKQETYAGPRAKVAAKEKLVNLISSQPTLS
ncbi:MAG: class D beta-lactamase [Candidatus Berkiella sp.]